jgi:hypothetical protein
MDVDELVATLGRNATTADCPDGAEQAVLWALKTAQSVGGLGELTAAETAAVVTRVGRRSLSRQAAVGHLTRLAKDGLVHRGRKRRGSDQYSIMAAGEEALAGGATVTLVDPARALQQTRDLESVLAQLKGEILICDPYLDSRTLDFVGVITGATSVRLLTEKVREPDKVRRELGALEIQIGAKVDIRKAPRGVLHDRYVIHDGGMLILGTSLNSFGLKQSFVSKAGNDVREATKVYYDQKWQASTPL